MTRPEAKLRGLKTYYNGPCRNGHVSGRYTSNGSCIDCVKAFSRKNPEVNRLSVRRYRDRNPGLLAAMVRRWRKENPDKVKNQKHMRRSAEGSFTPEDIKSIREDQGDRCVLCQCNLEGGGQIDHIYPISKGGSNWPSNLQLLCKPCNQRKSAKVLTSSYENTS